MDEDELRETCRLLLAHFVYSQARQEMLIKKVQEAAADGYRIGYSDAVAQAALRVPQTATAGVEEGFVLH